MIVLFPCHHFKRAQVDDMFKDQAEAFKALGWDIRTIDVDALDETGARVIGPPLESDHVFYRGWMLNAAEYHLMTDIVIKAGHQLLVSPDQYLSCHHLPGWYEKIKAFTPETHIFNLNVDLQTELKELGWDAFFIKDYVKSIKTSQGSLLHDPERIPELVNEMIRIRGEVEGGYCVRKVEHWYPETETRFFVINGQIFGSSQHMSLPEVLQEISPRIESPFFSIDLVKNHQDQWRVVEIGDGQVSDIVGEWTAERLAACWAQAMSL